jgi:hypothetical protein
MIGVDGELHDDFRFDEFLMLGEAETGAVVDLLTPVLDAKRQRARKAPEEEAFNRTVGLVVANALVGGERGVHYSRRLETYSGASPYRPTWLGAKRLLGVIDGLAREGLLDAQCGRWGGAFSKGVESSFAATPPLTDALTVHGIDVHVVQRDRASAPVIVLRGKSGDLIRYDPADERIAQQAKDLRAYNAFLAGQDITLRATAETPRLGDLTRIYNEGRWDRGGRHFGGWWQRIKSEQRSDILINGEETVELDYGGFMTRALYHLTGQEVRGDDPYDIPPIRRLFAVRGIDWDTKGRDAVKTMLNIAISAKSRNAFYTEESVEEISLPIGLIKVCLAIIFNHHASIKVHLLKGRSLELMNLESDICQDVICRGMSDGVVILPVFDSFITNSKSRDYLSQTMTEVYYNRLSFKPTIH